MTKTPALRGPLARPALALAAAALASLALAGCGGQDAKGASTVSAGSTATSTAPSAAPSAAPTTAPPGQAAYEAMLAKVAAICPPPGEKPAAPPSPVAPPKGEQSVAPDGSLPPEPALDGPETELDTREWCVSVQHEQRVLEALQKIAKPTPATVRKALNGLGYIDAHIHGLAQDGAVTRFRLDLRESGGRLCETGAAAGEQSDIDPCLASATGPFTVEKTWKRPA
ncbi:hypothetical protein [Streptomyces griseus]|uniref:hypothetical protein n=1 Tax=Streptomyces griseus TaxID=1911 RepID=UPI0004C9BA27|nr:hypothetical protein [Streptomyces griseus]